MIDTGGHTPLHRACTTFRSTLGDIQRLIKEDPQTLAKTDSDGRTPLLLACIFMNRSPAIVQLLLDRSPIRVLGICDHFGSTPLHHACRHTILSVDIILQMIIMYPKALRMLTDNGGTPLHCACVNASLELFKYCPEACLLLDNNYSHSPYDEAVVMGIEEDEGGALLRAATINAALALLVCVQQTLITVPPAVLAHIRQSFPGLFEEGLYASYMSDNQAIRQDLTNRETLRNLLQNDEIQTLLKQEDCQDLIRGVHPMVQAGRFHADREDSKHHMFIMESVSYSPDFMYLHLRSNPALCHRSTTNSSIPQQHQRESASTSTEHDTQLLVVNNATHTETARDNHARPSRKRKAPDYLR
jgi:hypothetical protein